MAEVQKNNSRGTPDVTNTRVPSMPVASSSSNNRSKVASKHAVEPEIKSNYDKNNSPNRKLSNAQPGEFQQQDKQKRNRNQLNTTQDSIEQTTLEGNEYIRLHHDNQINTILEARLKNNISKNNPAFSFSKDTGELTLNTMNNKTDRFWRPPAGGYFAETQHDYSSFRQKDPYHKPVVKCPEEIPHGRPLWLDQINKQVPAGAHYDVEATFGSSKLILKTRTKAFRSNQVDLNAPFTNEMELNTFFSGPTASPQHGVASYDPQPNKVKKRFPAFSQSKVKQSALWDAEVKKSKATPAPDSYSPRFNQTEVTRYEHRSLGRDIKITAKEIKATPGPGEYMTYGMRGTTLNHMLSNGWDYPNNAVLKVGGETFSMMNATTTTLAQKQDSLEKNFPGQPRTTRNSSALHHSLLGNSIIARIEQPPMCVGKSLKIESDLPIIKPKKQSKNKSVYSKELYHPGANNVQQEIEEDFSPKVNNQHILPRGNFGPRSVKAADARTEGTLFGVGGDRSNLMMRSQDPNMSTVQPILHQSKQPRLNQKGPSSRDLNKALTQSAEGSARTGFCGLPGKYIGEKKPQGAGDRWLNGNTQTQNSTGSGPWNKQNKESTGPRRQTSPKHLFTDSNDLMLFGGHSNFQSTMSNIGMAGKRYSKVGRKFNNMAHKSDQFSFTHSNFI